MNYIDADKLIKGVKHIQSEFPVITYEALFHLITSLQQEQEQTNKSFCEENCKGYRETGGKCFFGFNCSAMKAQEKPEVDLRIEIGRWMDKLDDKYCMLVESYTIQDIKDTARHFFKLGLAAGKEETK